MIERTHEPPRTILSWGLVILGALAVAVPADAVSPKMWRTVGVDGWEAAERESVGVASDGSVGMTASVIPAKDLDAFVVWDLLPDGKDVLAATGDAGVLYRIDGQGRAKEVTRVVQPELTSIGRDPKGRVLLGASPDGTVYRLKGDQAELLADTPESYVWRILPEKNDRVLVATGNMGKVYRLDGTGNLEIFADLGTTHVTGLERRGEGYVLTTDGPGRLVALDGSGKQEVLFDGGEMELRSPLPQADGSILFLANPSGSAGSLMRLSPEGAIEIVWSSESGFAYSLHAGGPGVVWVTRGEETGTGSVVQVHLGPPVTWMEEVTVQEPQVLDAAVVDGALKWIATGGQGTVHMVQETGADFGMATSPVRDAGRRARWGAISLEAGPVAGGIALETRSGNTRTADGTWSEWETVRMEGDRGAIPSPAARFLQWRVKIQDRDVRLGGIRVMYLPANVAPTVDSIEISELGESFREAASSRPGLYQNLSGGVRVEFQPQSGREDPEAGDAGAAWARRYRLVSWDASDANEDAMHFKVSLKGVHQDNWNSVASDLTDSPWVWDSATVPDGWYVLQVEASDEADNPKGGALEGRRVSEPFQVDNTPPRVLDLAVSGAVLTGSAEDAQTPIKRMEYAVDGKEWKVVFPEDGIADMPREAFKTTLDSLDSGTHVVMVRVFDRAGNPGTARVSFQAP